MNYFAKMEAGLVVELKPSTIKVDPDFVEDNYETYYPIDSKDDSNIVVGRIPNVETLLSQSNKELTVVKVDVKKSTKKSPVGRGKRRKQELSCASCMQLFTSQDKLNAHMKTFQFVCKNCPTHFANQDAQKRHTASAHVSKEYSCTICPDKYFSRNSYLWNHMKRHRIPEFVCEDCSKPFTSNQALKQHIKGHSTTRYVCPKCPFHFNRENSLRRHMKTHEGNRFYCTVCSKEFSIQYSLTKHMKSHTGTRFYCSQCPRHYSDMSGLKQHLSIHMGVKHTCEHCHEEYDYRSQLRTHVKKEHAEIE